MLQWLLFLLVMIEKVDVVPLAELAAVVFMVGVVCGGIYGGRGTV